jgi:hypothetical protein
MSVVIAFVGEQLSLTLAAGKVTFPSHSLLVVEAVISGMEDISGP